MRKFYALLAVIAFALVVGCNIGGDKSGGGTGSNVNLYRAIVNNPRSGYTVKWSVSGGDSGEDVATRQNYGRDQTLGDGQTFTIEVIGARSPTCKIGKVRQQRRGAVFGDTVAEGTTKCSFTQ